MKTVGSYDAKTHLPKLLEQVIRGERVTITRHGVPVAVLQAPDSLRRSNPKQVIAELREFRERHSLNGLSLREMIEQGRR
jgi:prevent-host-death family protein